MMSTGTTPTPPAPRTSPGKCPTVGGRAEGGFLQYVQLLNPRSSMSITNTKGLLNMPGQNNCFLNSAVQVLWHLDIFRRSFRELCGHACMEDSCIFCALKELFAQFQYSQESALPPDALRRALAETFCDQRRFQLGFMDDAAECFENILMRIHFHIANNESEDMCSAVHCIPHQKFAMTLVEQTVCHSCGATSEPLPFTQMVHYVPSSALCSQAKLMKEQNDQTPNFSELLKKAGGLGDLRDCPSSCGAVIQIRKTLMNRPEIVSIGLVWDSERPTIEHIMDVFKTIGMSLKLQDVFHSVVDSRWASTATHQLVGIVTYYGKHYSTFFFHTKLRVWIYFDDAAVREIGPKWEQVVEKCCRGHFQPLLLLYANPHGTPVSTSTAPRLVTVVPGHRKNPNDKDPGSINVSDKHMRLFQHPSTNNQRRALTPNPEVTCDMTPNIQPRRAVTPSGELSWTEEQASKPEISDSHASSAAENSTNHSIKSSIFHTATYPNFHLSSKYPEQISLRNPILDNLKLNRLSGRISVPNCSHFSDAAQAKLNRTLPNSNALNHPITVDNLQQPENDSEKMADPLSSLKDSEHSLNNAYISRQTVENILQLQKLQRQRSINNKNGNGCIGHRNSSSSLESLDNVFAKGYHNHLNLKFDIPDAANIARRRDSGNWSGDRNSASSSSTTSLDNPYFYVVGNKRPLNCMRSAGGRPGDTPSLTDAGYDSFSLSSSDSYPSAINNSPSKIDSRLGQIPEHVQTAFVPYDISQLQYCLKDLKNNEHFPFGFKDECDKLCAEADIFVAKSVERENVGDISMAALLSDTAAARARAAMDVPYTNSTALAMAKMKHSMCLIRSSNLHKKLKEQEVALRRKQKEAAIEAYHKEQQNAVYNKTSNDASTNSSESTLNDSLKSPQKPACAKQPEEQINNDKNIEIYATLPKRSLKKKGALSSFVESLTGDESCDEKSVKDKRNKTPDGRKSDGDISSNEKEDKRSKSPSRKKSFQKASNKDSDLSDYSSEWEHSKKTSLYRTYSGPTANSKNELSDINSSTIQSSPDHPAKKQHRIRRKLMGGFMRRKNRSLPDLREGQDSGGEAARSFDDCFFSQTPVSCRKNNSLNQEKSPPKGRQESSKFTHLTDSKSSKKCITRANTPPPYKPPPPIPHATSSNASSPKKNIQYHNHEAKKAAPPPTPPHDAQKQKSVHQPPVNRDLKQIPRKLNLHNVAHKHDELPMHNAEWLKELQLKQEELNLKRKQQEEREKWLAECYSGVDQKSAISSRKAECGRDLYNHNQQVVHDKEIHCLPRSVASCLSVASKDISPVSIDQQKSVRDLTTKFENICVSPSDSNSENTNDVKTVETTAINSDQIAQSRRASNEIDKSHCHSTANHYCSPKLSDKSFNQSDCINERLCSPVNAKQTQMNSSNVYNHHLTDAQLTNVLRIGGNRSSFRNSKGESQDDLLFRYPREACVMHEAKRPDKPPDYETALQRLELLRNDRNFSKFYAPNFMNFEDILEQAKKRRGPKKSVTFSDKVVLVACAGDEDNDFIPNPLLERVYKQHFQQKPNGLSTEIQDNDLSLVHDVSATETPAPEPKISDSMKSSNSPLCNLCHKKTVEPSKLYCPDCAFYMSRFQQK
ncbi:serine-rich adhesin for platelets isoform X2 [Parasteatoda tepidariorum]|uniref:serine-rich adhesin for platelets isoform X2 n=1 Tax=Parasteatoda tepidariorum TaxID=114398 RepID=UPI00077FDC98|nr:uncharacterized protein LOC107440583 isoform X2 [Parasteatoda tepidariorum]XP_015909044.1 uncharacterized protein LOC107440583 isoform X2 [Parasteatoda tepidariorum]